MDVHPHLAGRRRVIVEHWACRDDMGLVEQLND